MNPSADRDRRIAELSEQLIEIEERLIPTGLHVLGRSPDSDKRADLLRMIASFDRPEHGVRALTNLIAEAAGIDSYEEVLQHGPNNEARELIDRITKETIEVFSASGADAAGEFLKSRANVEIEASRPSFELLADIGRHLDSNRELEA